MNFDKTGTRPATNTGSKIISQNRHQAANACCGTCARNILFIAQS